MLRIEGFALQGSEGSVNFGHPIPVETAEVVKELMSQLGMESRNGGLDQANRLDPRSSGRSQAGITAYDSSSPEDSTQAAFSTQAPTKVSNGQVIGGHADPDASRRALMAILGSKRTNAQQAPPRDHKPTTTYLSSYTQKPRGNLVNGSSDSASSPSPSRQHSTMPSSSAILPIEPRAGSKKRHGHLQGSVVVSQAASESDISKSQNVRRREDSDINGDLLSKETSTSGRIENSAEVRKDGYTSLGYTATTKSHQIPDITSGPIQGADNPWEGLTRIPRKYVQMPKDQRNILERDDAWYPQAPGNRQPGINLPPKVLIGLQAFKDRLIDIASNGQSASQSDSQSDSQSNSQNDSHSDSHSDSHNVHSEKQKVRPAKGSHGVKKAARKSIRGKGLPSLGVSSSGQDGAIARMASSESVSSDKDDSSMEGSLNAAEIDSECETGVRNLERSHIQVGKILPNGKILLDFEADVSSASQDRVDGSSAEEAISWPSSPNRVEEYSSRNHSLQEGPQESATNNRIDAPNLFQSLVPPSEISPTALIDVESPSTEEDEADSEVESFSALQNHAELQPMIATGRMTQTSKTAVKSSSVLFSSSPVEMELSVPYALGNQIQLSDDVVMTNALDAAQPTLDMREQPHSRSDLERTQRTFSDSRSPWRKTHNVKPDGTSNLRQQKANISSDPIIPGTFGSEASNILTRPVDCISATNQVGLECRAFEADQVISATPGPPSRFHSYSPSSADGEKYSPQRQKYAESKTSTQKGREVRSVNDTSVSVDIASKASIVRQTFWDSNESEIHMSPTIHEPSQLSIPGTQVSSSEPVPPRHAPIGDEIIFLTLATTIKRRVYEMWDMTEPSPKRQRTLQTVIFDSAQEKDSAIDPTEMANANRRKFLQELSLEHSSQIQIPHKPYEDSTAQSNIASDAVAEMVSEHALARDPTRAFIDDASPTGPPLGEMDAAPVHLEKLSVEELRDTSLDHAGHDADEIDEEASDGRRNDNGDIRKGSTRSQQGRTTKDYERDSAETHEHEQDKDSPTVTKVQSGHKHTSQTETIFDIFNTAYPSYGKSLRAFVRACVCLDWLHSMKKAPHPSLWDDFIRAFSAEYADHIDECKLLKQKPMSAPEFYNNHVLQPVFVERIMTLARLQEAFPLDPKETAKNRAIILEKKHQKSQESISTASSQLMITSETSAESQDTPTASPGNFFSTQRLPSPSVITSHVPPDHAWDVEMSLSHVLGVVSAPPSTSPARKPFFETPSQLVTQGRHNVVESPLLSTSTPGKDGRINAPMEDPSKRFESPDIEIVQANAVKQTPRHLPWSSSPQARPEPEELVEVNGPIPGWSSARSQSQSYRQPPVVSPLRQRKGSPILGSVTPNSISTRKEAVQAEISPTLSSNLGFRQDPIFKTPHLPASKSLGRRTTSMLGLGGTGVGDLRTSYRDERLHSLWMAKTQKPIISTITATFKDFSKAFVPRQKRRSSVFSRVSTPGSDPSPSRRVTSNTLGSRLLAEPDTQVWRF